MCYKSDWSRNQCVVYILSSKNRILVYASVHTLYRTPKEGEHTRENKPVYDAFHPTALCYEKPVGRNAFINAYLMALYLLVKRVFFQFNTFFNTNQVLNQLFNQTLKEQSNVPAQ